jgi:hypothetical protein
VPEIGKADSVPLWIIGQNSGQEVHAVLGFGKQRFWRAVELLAGAGERPGREVEGFLRCELSFIVSVFAFRMS